MESAKSSRWPWRKKSIHTHVVTASPNQGTYERRSRSISDTLLTNNTSRLQHHAQIAEGALSESEGVGGRGRKKEVEEKDGVDEEKSMKERKEEEVRSRTMEAKISEAEQQLIAAEAEKSVILSSLQQRDAALALLSSAKNKAESQLQSLYANITALLKENSRLKYELHLLHKEHHIIRNSTTTPDDVMCKHSADKEKVFAEPRSLESELQVLRSVGCEVEAISGDADDVSSAQSLASAMIAELHHFSRKDKAAFVTHTHDVASSSHPTQTDHDTKDWRSNYISDGTTIASMFYTSSSEIVKLVKALAHPLLYSTANSNKSISENKFIHGSSELSESELQLNIEKLEKASESGGTSVSLASVEFLQVLAGVLNRLVKITLYRNAQRDGCSDDSADQDDDLTAFASVSQTINAAFLSPLPTIPDFNEETRPAIAQDKLPTKRENEGECMSIGGQGHPSLNSKRLITPTTTTTTTSSSSSKLFHFNSNYIKTAIQSTISKRRSESRAAAPSYPHVKSKPPNKLLNRLLTFS